jgi:hypothetical protein
MARAKSVVAELRAIGATVKGGEYIDSTETVGEFMATQIVIEGAPETSVLLSYVLTQKSYLAKLAQVRAEKAGRTPSSRAVKNVEFTTEL